MRTNRDALERRGRDSSSEQSKPKLPQAACVLRRLPRAQRLLPRLKNEPGNYRYCHHFSNEEIDRIITALAPHATVIESFSADGKPGNLNRYVVFKREELPIDSIPATNALSSMTDEEIRQLKVKTLTLS